MAQDHLESRENPFDHGCTVPAIEEVKNVMKRVILTLAVLGGASLVAARLLLTSGTGRPSDETGDVVPTPNTPHVIEQVGVAGSDVQFPTPIENTAGTNKEQLVLTGTALRKKLIFKLYAIGSYIQDGVKVSSADELCNKDCSKQLHLVMECAISGEQMAGAFKEAIRLNHPEPEFAAEIKELTGYLQTFSLAKGDHVWLISVPRLGLKINVAGKPGIQIENPAFAKAIWEVYLGKKNLGEPLKADLVSRLKSQGPGPARP